MKQQEKAGSFHLAYLQNCLADQFNKAIGEDVQHIYETSSPFLSSSINFFSPFCAVFTAVHIPLQNAMFVYYCSHRNALISSILPPLTDVCYLHRRVSASIEYVHQGRTFVPAWLYLQFLPLMSQVNN